MPDDGRWTPGKLPGIGLSGDPEGPDLTAPEAPEALGVSVVAPRMMSATSGGQNDVSPRVASPMLPAPREKAAATAGSVGRSAGFFRRHG